MIIFLWYSKTSRPGPLRISYYKSENLYFNGPDSGRQMPQVVLYNLLNLKIRHLAALCFIRSEVLSPRIRCFTVGRPFQTQIPCFVVKIFLKDFLLIMTSNHAYYTHTTYYTATAPSYCILNADLKSILISINSNIIHKLPTLDHGSICNSLDASKVTRSEPWPKFYLLKFWNQRKMLLFIYELLLLLQVPFLSLSGKIDSGPSYKSSHILLYMDT